MKNIFHSTKRGAVQGLSVLLAALILAGCGREPSVPTTSSAYSETKLPPAVTTVGEETSLTQPPPTTDEPTVPPTTDGAAYRWDPYCFDRLSGAYEEDARLLADAILGYADGVTLSSEASAETVLDNIAFEFPPAVLADLRAEGDRVQITYLHGRAEHEKQLAAFETAVNRALSLLSAEDGEVRRATLLYDYVVKNVSYLYVDYTDKDITAFDALVEGVTICYGFADAFGYLLRQTGMEARLWRGGTYTFTGFSDHGWCYAKVDGAYYHFDPTWEHSNYKTSQKNSFTYFGMSDQKRFTSLSKTCVSGFGVLEETCNVKNAPQKLEPNK